MAIITKLDETRSLRQLPESGYPGYGEYVDPSRFWGEKLGLPEIYETYDAVLDDRHAELQATLFCRPPRAAPDSDVINLYELLVAAYPDLPTDLAHSEQAVRHIVFGCVTKLVSSDIRFYLTKRSTRQDIFWRDRKIDVERLAQGFHLEWCPSFQTLDVLETRLLEIGGELDLTSSVLPSPV